MAYSSSKKLQHFETPINLERSLGRVNTKKSEAKYVVNEGDEVDSKEKSKLTSEARRKLLRNS